jgi:hypothetical protein
LTEIDEQTINKVINLLIQILHGEHSDTRDLAVVQLVLLGKKAVPPLTSFLKKEDELREDLEALKKDTVYFNAFLFQKKWHRSPDSFYSDYGLKPTPTRYAIEGALKALRLLGINNFNDLFPHIILAFNGNTEIRAFFEN